MNKADISITSTVVTDEGEDKISFFTEGDYVKTPDGYILSYEENEGIGYEFCTVKITAKDSTVTVERTGDASANMTVEKNVKHHCIYSTPFGDFTMGINTFDVVNTLGDSGGRLYFKYSIDINSDFISENQMEIIIKNLNS